MLEALLILVAAAGTMLLGAAAVRATKSSTTAPAAVPPAPVAQPPPAALSPAPVTPPPAPIAWPPPAPSGDGDTNGLGSVLQVAGQGKAAAGTVAALGSAAAAAGVTGPGAAAAILAVAPIAVPLATLAVFGDVILSEITKKSDAQLFAIAEADAEHSFDYPKHNVTTSYGDVVEVGSDYPQAPMDIEDPGVRTRGRVTKTLNGVGGTAQEWADARRPGG
jgi:hypothetical protein